MYFKAGLSMQQHLPAAAFFSAPFAMVVNE
jgi:hypothetical protein